MTCKLCANWLQSADCLGEAAATLVNFGRTYRIPGPPISAGESDAAIAAERLLNKHAQPAAMYVRIAQRHGLPLRPVSEVSDATSR